jgi:hypothetical protein
MTRDGSRPGWSLPAPSSAGGPLPRRVPRAVLRGDVHLDETAGALAAMPSPSAAPETGQDGAPEREETDAENAAASALALTLRAVG